ncbi:MAG: TonB-dependent receptor [Dokdonella sp.]|uniref:TonB-dependent receptor n=1 Tax=Dokdonella sp. TaxID=2291710 RepID=UPI0032656FCA
MKYPRTILSASILAVLAFAGTAHAADGSSNADQGASTPGSPAVTVADASQPEGQEMETVVVHGIRESLKRSLETKREANAVVDAITAEDIGKFPSTNVAEAMSQIPGVTIDRRFGQGERVSINGTDPSLNLTFLDGHPVAQTTWLYGEQPNRGFDYTLLAPEILGKLEVYKSPEARLPEGSIGGTIIMHTRQPLDLDVNTLSASVGANYGDQSDATKPNASILYSWKNPEGTFGFAISGQHYEEKVDRQGEEIFGYSPVSSLAAGSPAVAAGIASGALDPNALVPQEINAAYFQQTRKRNSATLNMQWKPTDEFELDVRGLYVREKFNNFNQSMYGFTTQTPQNITSLTPGPGGIITGGHSCGNDDPGCAGLTGNGGNGPVNTYLDNQVRISTVTTKGLDLTGTYKGDGWGLSGQIGQSKSDNTDNSQAFIEPYYNGGYSWDIRRGITFDNPSAAADPANWHDGDTPGGGWGGNYAQWPATAKDTYGQLDFSKDFQGFINQLLVGVRVAKHHEERELSIFGGVRTGNLATIGFDGLTDILANFSGFSGDQRHHVQTSFDNVLAWVLGSPLGTSPDPGSFLNNSYAISQKSQAGYAQLNFGTDALHGNFGLRFVHTEIESSGYSYSGVPTYPAPEGSYQTANVSHNNTLPSFNIAYDLSSDVVLRGAVAEVIAWAPYNQEVHNTFLNDTVLTGSGGNANLDPYKSVNFDLSVEWYFAEQSVLAASVFYKNISNYITTDSHIERQFNSQRTTDPAGYQRIFVDGHLGNCDVEGFCDYSVLRPLDGGRAKVKGLTLSYQQPFGDTGFGMFANYTLADGTTASGTDLPYNSKNAINLSPYYEKGPFSARLTYGWRSHYLAGGYVAGSPPASVAAYRELDASASWHFTNQFSVNVNAMNLLDETYLQYLGNKDLIAGKYSSGRRYMATLHYDF